MARVGDFIGQMNDVPNSENSTKANNSKQQVEFDNSAELAYLRSIDSALKKIISNSNNISQSNAFNAMYGKQDFRNPYSRRTGNGYRGAKSSFIDRFENGIFEGIVGSDFKDKIKDAVNDMADTIGLNLKDIPSEVGKSLSAQAISALKSTELGKKLTDGINKYANAAMNSILSRVNNHDKAHNNTPNNSGKDTTTFSQYAKTQSSKSISYVESNLAASEVFDDILYYVQHIDAILYKSGTDKYMQDNPDSSKGWYDGELEDYSTFSKASLSQDKEARAAAEKQAAEKAASEESKLAEGASSKPNLDFGQDKLGDLIKDSKLGNKLSGLKDKALSGIDSIFGEGTTGKLGTLLKDAGSNLIGKIGVNTAGAAATSAGSVGTGLAAAGSAAGTAAAGLTSVASIASAACPYILAAVAAIKLGKIAVDLFAKDLKEASKELYQNAKAAANRYQESRDKNLKEANKRLERDTKKLVEAPFEILKEAAQKVYDVWEGQLRKINGTQGYSKSDLQDLMSAYAQRLRDENLSSVIGTTDVTENLSKVLDSGLSGKVAEEFAYIATKLNAAVPTQDFFGYAEEYSSVAANAIRQGKSQSEAIAYANTQLESFASSILYSSRQLAGGFTTGLKDAQSLFESAVKISQAAKTNNSSQIAGVLTSVSAITGSIAPDLASSMTDAIVKAATGGNSSEIVALRSLAGINASNTEFLKQLANDPQKVFSTLFDNLSKMQNMSQGAYMEVAEGLSSVFGLSIDAFSRIDFKYLADAIRNMNVSNSSLDENMQLLISGQTTTKSEQIKLQQINKYMIDEGLAYVLDNQVARSIQEHMWDEQMNRELMENEYAVNLQGSALKFLEGIRTTVENIINFLNPFAGINKLVNLAATAIEGNAREADLRKVLELGKVGNGNTTQLHQLTTRNADLNVAPSIVSMMGGSSLYDLVSTGRGLYNSLTHAGGVPSLSLITDTNFMNNLVGSISAGIQKSLTSSSKNLGIGSKYKWGTLGKSAYSMISGQNISTGKLVESVLNSSDDAASSSPSLKGLNKMLEEGYINKFVEAEKSYEDWAASARSVGISNLQSVIEQSGLTEDQLRGRFQSAQANAGAKKNLERIKNEDAFWVNGNQFWADTLKYEENILTESRAYWKSTSEYQTSMITESREFWQSTVSYESSMLSKIDTANSHLKNILSKCKDFYANWVDYFVNHTAYNNSYSYQDVEKIKQASKTKESGDLVNALAAALVKNSVDLKDPQVQTNALLSQILIVAQAIMNQNNKVGGLSLPDTLNALALGLIKKS